MSREPLAVRVRADTITVRATLRWWVLPYAYALVLFGIMFGAEPDWAKLIRLIVRRGIRFEVVR